MLFEIQVHDLEGWRIVAPIGELDLADAHTLRAQVIQELQAGRRRIVVDLGGLDFVDSVGVGMLVAMNKRANALGAQVVLARPEARVRKVLELAGVDRIMTVHDDLLPEGAGGSGGPLGVEAGGPGRA